MSKRFLYPAFLDKNPRTATRSYDWTDGYQVLNPYRSLDRHAVVF